MSTERPKPDIRAWQPTKTWIKASRRTHNHAHQATNLTLECLYMSIIGKAKGMLVGNKQPMFERDYRKDTTESLQAMHSFMSSSFYFYLECDILNEYRVEYAFHNCPFESDIRAMLIVYPFDTRSHEIQLQPDFNTYYRRVLNFQDKKYITQ